MRRLARVAVAVLLTFAVAAGALATRLDVDEHALYCWETGLWCSADHWFREPYRVVSVTGQKPLGAP